jgi:hypothetical protein
MSIFQSEEKKSPIGFPLFILPFVCYKLRGEVDSYRRNALLSDLDAHLLPVHINVLVFFSSYPSCAELLRTGRALKFVT